ncbi:hypothetical protein E2542_SST27730 [Spatholobus suberectus]|nr:hypothetical protein E2542_SST27730 [Spatholobus suberectus]
MPRPTTGLVLSAKLVFDKALSLSQLDKLPTITGKDFSLELNVLSVSMRLGPTNRLKWFSIETMASIWNAPTCDSPSTLSTPSVEPNSTLCFSLPPKIHAKPTIEVHSLPLSHHNNNNKKKE